MQFDWTSIQMHGSFLKYHYFLLFAPSSSHSACSMHATVPKFSLPKDYLFIKQLSIYIHSIILNSVIKHENVQLYSHTVQWIITIINECTHALTHFLTVTKWLVVIHKQTNKQTNNQNWNIKHCRLAARC